jgi:hypothetical protein
MELADEFELALAQPSRLRAFGPDVHLDVILLQDLLDFKKNLRMRK